MIINLILKSINIIKSQKKLLNNIFSNVKKL